MTEPGTVDVARLPHPSWCREDDCRSLDTRNGCHDSGTDAFEVHNEKVKWGGPDDEIQPLEVKHWLYVKASQLVSRQVGPHPVRVEIQSEEHTLLRVHPFEARRLAAALLGVADMADGSAGTKNDVANWRHRGTSALPGLVRR